jgi:hypothetical protein
VLPLTIFLHHRWVRLPTLLLILRIFLPPLPLTIAYYLAVLGIRRQLFAAGIRSTPALTIRSPANPLLWAVPRRKKEAFAIETALGLAHVVLLSPEFRRSLRRIEVPTNEQERREIKDVVSSVIKHGAYEGFAIPANLIEDFRRVNYEGGLY